MDADKPPLRVIFGTHPYQAAQQIYAERLKMKLIFEAFNLTNRANYGNNFGNNIASASTFGHPAGFIAPASTIIPHALWGELGARFTF